MIDHQMHWYPRSYFESILDRHGFPRTRRDGAGGYVFQASPREIEWAITPPYFDLDASLAQAAADGVEAAVISPNLVGDVTWYELGEARATLALLHDEYARAQQRHGSRFIGLCMLPLQDTAAAIETLDDAIGRLGLRGVLMNVAPGGRPLVSEVTGPVFERIEELGVPVFLHPANRSLVWDFSAPFGRLAESGLGWMFDTSLAALSLITSGTLDRLPGLVVVHPHAGGTLPFVAGRLLATAASTGAAGALDRPLGEYFRERFYVDSAMPTRGALELARDLYGERRILFGADHPFHVRANVLARLAENVEPGLLEQVLANRVAGL